MKKIGPLVLVAMVFAVPAMAQTVLFDFDNAPLYAPLPLDLTVQGITAHFSATGQGYSIQQANTMGFTPQGFAGYCIYPSSIYLSDLLISFSVTLTDFSIMYAPEEYGCDSSATLRVTAYMNGAYVGTNTTTAYPPGTWPTGTLTFSSAQGFNSVVVHYDAPPPTGGDWGPIFMADNMYVTQALNAAVGGTIASATPTTVIAPNPFVNETTVRFSLAHAGLASVAIYDAQGRLVRTLMNGTVLDAGVRTISWDGRDDTGHEAASGVYLCRVGADSRTTTTRMLLLRSRT